MTDQNTNPRYHQVPNPRYQREDSSNIEHVQHDASSLSDSTSPNTNIRISQLANSPRGARDREVQSHNKNNNNNYEPAADEPSDPNDDPNMNIDTTPNQPDEFNIFGHKISKSAVYALILIFIGFCMFLGGLVTIFLGGDQKQAVQKKVPAWQQRNPSVSSRTMTGVTISTFGCFIAIFGSAWYCFAKKNKLRDFLGGPIFFEAETKFF